MGRIRWQQVVILCVPVLAALALYADVTDAGFAFDDPIAVIGNPLVDGTAPFSDVITTNFWGDRPGFEHLASWRPLTVASLRLDHFLGDGAAATFHTTNLLLHALVVLAAGLLFLRLAVPVAAAAAGMMVIAVHPLFGEAVASIVGRGDLLAALLGLLGLRALVGGQFRGVVALGLALLAKESAVIFLLPAFILALQDRDRQAAVLLLFAAGIWYGARVAVVGGLGGVVTPIDNQLAGLDFSERLPGALGVVGRYLGHWLVPTAIAADHGPAVDLAGPQNAFAIIGAAGSVALIGATIAALRHRQLLIVLGLLIALVGLALLSNIAFILPTPFAGRLAYAPAVGLALALGGAFAGRLGTMRYPALFIVGAWLGIGTLATRAEVRAWQDDASLFSAAVDAEPRSARSRSNLARQALEAGQPEIALAHLEAARLVAPHHPLVLTNLAVALERTGQQAEAWRVAQAAVSAEVRPGNARGNLCALALARPDVDDALVVVTCENAVRALPDAPEPLTNLGRALARAKRDADAESVFAQARARFPDNAFVLGHVTGFLASRGRFDDAVATQRQLVAMAPADAERRRNLVALLLSSGGNLKAAGESRAACARGEEARSLVPGVQAVQQRAAFLCASPHP
ncbi:MAG: hypothetical protein R3F39_24450 [Myxococcota bacterium]